MLALQFFHVIVSWTRSVA